MKKLKKPIKIIIFCPNHINNKVIFKSYKKFFRLVVSNNFLFRYMSLISPKYKKQFFSALAYVINKKGAKKLLKKTVKNNKIVLSQKFRRPIADIYLYKTLKTYAYKYPFFVPSSKDSNIQEKDLIDHKTSKRMMIQLLKNE